MSTIIVFGAGGRAGRQIVSEAARGGHAVTAVVRDPSKYEDLAHENITLVEGDVTQTTDVATLSAGHDAAVNAAGRMDIDATEFYTAATRALIDGLGQAGVQRLVPSGSARRCSPQPAHRSTTLRAFRPKGVRSPWATPPSSRSSSARAPSWTGSFSLRPR